MIRRFFLKRFLVLGTFFTFPFKYIIAAIEKSKIPDNAKDYEKDYYNQAPGRTYDRSKGIPFSEDEGSDIHFLDEENESFQEEIFPIQSPCASQSNSNDLSGSKCQ